MKRYFSQKFKSMAKGYSAPQEIDEATAVKRANKSVPSSDYYEELSGVYYKQFVVWSEDEDGDKEYLSCGGPFLKHW